jgi:hypothetical protein
MVIDNEAPNNIRRGIKTANSRVELIKADIAILKVRT